MSLGKPVFTHAFLTFFKLFIIAVSKLTATSESGNEKYSTKDDPKLKKKKKSGNICLPCGNIFYKYEHFMLCTIQCRVEASKKDAILLIHGLISSLFDGI